MSEPDSILVSEASVVAREALLDFAAKFAKSELAGVTNPIPLNQMISRYTHGALEAIRTRLAEAGL